VRIHACRHWAVFSLVGVWGCTAVPADHGAADAYELMSRHGLPLPDRAAADRSLFIEEQLATPLTVDAAVGVALVNNPGLQIEFARLGVPQADVIHAGRLSNPTLGASWQTSSRSSDASRYGLSLTQNFAELLMLGARSRLAEGEFERAKLDMVQRVLDLDARVRAAFYDAVGAKQVAQMRSTVAAAAVASADLSARYHDAGNLATLELAIAEAAASQAKLDQERAEADAARAVVVLNELMGLDANARWDIAAALPLPVTVEDSVADLQQIATTMRADLDSDRRAVALLEDALGLTERYRYLGEVQVGVEYERDTDRNRLIGPTLAIQLPIFNQGQAAMLRAASMLDAARAQLRTRELEVSNGVRAANERLMAQRQRIARLVDETMPLREQIVARMQERLNYMLVGAFDLIRAKQDEYQTYEQYLDAVRYYWHARVDLSRAIGARLPSDRMIGKATITAPVSTWEGQ
jgi:outer membrane protein, heavy metal efflux system